MFSLRHQEDWTDESKCKSMVRRLFNWPQLVMCSLEPDQQANPNNLDHSHAQWTNELYREMSDEHFDIILSGG